MRAHFDARMEDGEENQGKKKMGTMEINLSKEVAGKENTKK